MRVVCHFFLALDQDNPEVVFRGDQSITLRPNRNRLWMAKLQVNVNHKRFNSYVLLLSSAIYVFLVTMSASSQQPTEALVHSQTQNEDRTHSLTLALEASQRHPLVATACTPL